MEEILNVVTKIFSALLTPVLAIIGTWILIKQHQLQKLRWKLDLYDKRYPVFTATMEYIAYIVQRHNVSDDELFKFLRGSKDKEFLFGDDIKVHLENLYKKGLYLQILQNRLNSLPVGEQRNETVDESSQLFEWFTQQFDVSKTLFAQYLGVDKK